MKKSNSPRFDDVQSVSLRTWNRCSVVFNLRADAGDAEATAYVAQFDDISRHQMKAMFDYIMLKGYSTVRCEVTNGTMDQRVAANG